MAKRSRGYYVRVNGRIYNAKTKKARIAISEAGRRTAPITYWNGSTWSETARVLGGLNASRPRRTACRCANRALSPAEFEAAVARRNAYHETVLARNKAGRARCACNGAGKRRYKDDIDAALASGRTILIVSGEGERGHEEVYRGARTHRALAARLTKERAGGDRWANIGLR